MAMAHREDRNAADARVARATAPTSPAVEDSGQERAGTERPFSAYELPAVALLLLLCLVTILSARHGTALNVIHSPGLAVSIAVASLLIALGAAYFALGEFILYGLSSSLYIGLAFLVFAAAHAGLGVVPLVASAVSNAGVVTYGWGVDRIVGGCLLVAAALLVKRTTPVFLRRRRVTTGTALVLALSLVSTVWAYHSTTAPVAASTDKALQLCAGALFFLASFIFWRIAKSSRRTWFFWLSFSLAIAGFAQLQYGLHLYPLGVVQPGDILLVVFFGGILLALMSQWTNDYRRLRWQARELEALQQLGTAPNVRVVHAVVAHIVQVVGESLGADARVLVADRAQTATRDPLSEQMLALGAGCADVSGDGAAGVVVGFDEGGDGQVALGVPLDTSSRRVGMLVVVRPSGDQFSSHDMRLLRALGLQASVLLERSLLYEEVAAGAVLEERSRLAREIHDGLAQHLAFLKMRVSWLQRSAEPIERKQLKDVESVLETALIEARHAITTLRADVQSATAREAIEGYVEEFSHVAGVRMEVNCQPDVPDVGPKARVELLRVVQESLNNVRKHAHATCIALDIRAQDGGMEVAVRDDGEGFEVGRSLEGHFGLQIMSERAASVGGNLSVQSRPDVGTEVRIWVPSQETGVDAPTQSPFRTVQG
ncbi:MAG: histidine kinase [Chloroflexota bacterium]|nr:MAG: hypothetical protein DLM70_15690 [Chloroflexota bacterium]